MGIINPKPMHGSAASSRLPKGPRGRWLWGCLRQLQRDRWRSIRGRIAEVGLRRIRAFPGIYVHLLTHRRRRASFTTTTRTIASRISSTKLSPWWVATASSRARLAAAATADTALDHRQHLAKPPPCAWWMWPRPLCTAGDHRFRRAAGHSGGDDADQPSDRGHHTL